MGKKTAKVRGNTRQVPPGMDPVVSLSWKHRGWVSCSSYLPPHCSCKQLISNAKVSLLIWKPLLYSERSNSPQWGMVSPESAEAWTLQVSPVPILWFRALGKPQGLSPGWPTSHIFTGLILLGQVPCAVAIHRDFQGRPKNHPMCSGPFGKHIVISFQISVPHEAVDLL